MSPTPVDRTKSRAASSVGVPAPDDGSVGAALGKDDQKAPVAQTTDYDDVPLVLMRADLAKLLRMSLRTLDEVRARHGHLPPEMTRLDDRPRWAKATVLAWMAQTDAAARFRLAARRIR